MRIMTMCNLPLPYLEGLHTSFGGRIGLLQRRHRRLASRQVARTQVNESCRMLLQKFLADRISYAFVPSSYYYALHFVNLFDLLRDRG